MKIRAAYIEIYRFLQLLHVSSININLFRHRKELIVWICVASGQYYFMD